MEYDVSLQTISWVNERKNDESLEISPKFQRRAVWLDRERAFLINTICSNLPFPEIYMQIVTDPETGKQKYVVVDGQQRITSILMFINGQFPLPSNEQWDGEYFRDLTSSQKEAFWDYTIVVRYLRKTNDAEIRELFTKLNTNNIALNDQELRNARFTGRFKALAERLADNPLFQAMGLFTPRDIRRMLDIEYVSELLVRQIFGITNKKDMLDTAYYNFDEEFPGEAEYETKFNIALTLVRAITDGSAPSFFKTKGNFYSLFGVCLTYHEKTGNVQFLHLDEIKHSIVDLLSKAKNDEFDKNHPEIERYAEVSTRSTSDKSRRAEREQILLELLRRHEEF